MIFKQAIIHWRNHAPWIEDAQVEQDLILSGMIFKIYSDHILTQDLAFRGGTCLNKLYWEKPTRYSEDLDFVHIKSGKIGTLIDRLRGVSDPLFSDPPTWERRRNGFRLYYSFLPEGGGAAKNIKVEINTREHFSVEGFVKQSLKLDSPWMSGTVPVTTFSFEEILATKLRALYQRKKGRDLYDLWKAKSLKPDWKKVAQIFLKYMSKDSKIIFRDDFLDNLNQKVQEKMFLHDTNGLLMVSEAYDVGQAAQFVAEEIFVHIPRSKKKQNQERKER